MAASCRQRCAWEQASKQGESDCPRGGGVHRPPTTEPLPPPPNLPASRRAARGAAPRRPAWNGRGPASRASRRTAPAASGGDGCTREGAQRAASEASESPGEAPAAKHEQPSAGAPSSPRPAGPARPPARRAGPPRRPRRRRSRWARGSGRGTCWCSRLRLGRQDGWQGGRSALHGPQVDSKPGSDTATREESTSQAQDAPASWNMRRMSPAATSWS